ncbi:MAG TPA: sodium ion-translocating decarboxylase subunit beta [Bacillota bacterium]|nr:sodium ion-translocating decarboxylase subunit beta [Bacillota bacterium]
MEGLMAGIIELSWHHAVMWAIGLTLIYLAVKKGYEPLLLIPIGFGAVMANLPLSGAVTEAGPLTLLLRIGVLTELFPILIFIGVGAMCDFSPLLRNPEVMLIGAAAQIGIFATIIAASLLRFPLTQAVAIGILGTADGPTTIFVASLYAPEILGPLALAAYSYMALTPLIMPPVIRLLTTPDERRIRMVYSGGPEVSRTARLLFPLCVVIVAGLIAPVAVPLVGFLMLGNFLRECGVAERLSHSAQNELVNVVTLLLGLTIGGTMTAETFLNWVTLGVMALGLAAMVFATAGGIIIAKFLNLLRREKINPMIGAAGISAFPMAGRVVAKMAFAEDRQNYLLMHAVAVNISGQLCSIVAGVVVIAVSKAILGL